MRSIADKSVKLSGNILEDLKQVGREKRHREKEVSELVYQYYLRGRADEALEIRRDYELKPKKVVPVKDEKAKAEEEISKLSLKDFTPLSAYLKERLHNPDFKKAFLKHISERFIGYGEIGEMARKMMSSEVEKLSKEDRVGAVEVYFAQKKDKEITDRLDSGLVSVFTAKPCTTQHEEAIRKAMSVVEEKLRADISSLKPGDTAEVELGFTIKL